MLFGNTAGTICFMGLPAEEGSAGETGCRASLGHFHVIQGIKNSNLAIKVGSHDGNLPVESRNDVMRHAMCYEKN